MFGNRAENKNIEKNMNHIICIGTAGKYQFDILKSTNVLINDIHSEDSTKQIRVQANVIENGHIIELQIGSIIITQIFSDDLISANNAIISSKFKTLSRPSANIGGRFCEFSCHVESWKNGEKKVKDCLNNLKKGTRERTNSLNSKGDYKVIYSDTVLQNKKPTESKTIIYSYYNTTHLFCYTVQTYPKKDKIIFTETSVEITRNKGPDKVKEIFII
jgi:hypothetical protein